MRAAFAIVTLGQVLLCGCSSGCKGGKSGAADAAADAPSGPVVGDGLTDAEAHEMHAYLPREFCETAAKRYNRLAGRGENDPDPKVLEMQAACLRYANLAWQKCLVGARTTDDIDRCNARLLRPPP